MGLLTGFNTVIQREQNWNLFDGPQIANVCFLANVMFLCNKWLVFRKFNSYLSVSAPNHGLSFLQATPSRQVLLVVQTNPKSGVLFTAEILWESDDVTGCVGFWGGSSGWSLCVVLLWAGTRALQPPRNWRQSLLGKHLQISCVNKRGGRIKQLTQWWKDNSGCPRAAPETEGCCWSGGLWMKCWG